ncbi:MAG: hypothetical protein NXH78_01995 [Hyphomonadaceae bacterium]|nr:hypothetical protein [Hyphomonadaceae bacterium]
MAKSQEKLKSETPEALGKRLTIVRYSSGSVLTAIERRNTEELFPGAQCFAFEEFHAQDLSDRPTLNQKQFRDKIFVDADCTIAIRHGSNTTMSSKKLSSKVEIDSVIDRVRADAISKVTLIQAPGGTGKSHLARYANDRLVERSSEVVFLDAQLVRQCLTSDGYQNLAIRSIYDIYRLCADHSKQLSPLTEERFRLRFKLRDTAIVVDGLEEIYALLGPSFDVNALLDDSLNYLEDNINGIIIFTSRKDFWKESEFDNFRVINLYPFSISNAKTYFRKLFDGDLNKINSAMTIINTMANNDGFVLPLYCDLVGQQMKSMSNIETNAHVQVAPQERFSNLLIWVLDREMERTDSVDWEHDGSFEFLERVAYESVDKPLGFQQAKQILREVLGRELSDKDVGAIENHKLLTVDASEGLVIHRYPFLKTALIARHLSGLLKETGPNAWTPSADSSDSLSSLIGSNLLIPGSDLAEALLLELSDAKNSELRSRLKQAIQSAATNIIDEPLRPGPLTFARNLVNNLFSIMLRLYSEDLGNPSNNTLIMRECFDVGGGEYTGLTMVGYAQSGELTIAFDFSDLTISAGLFVDYPDFWKCSANESTTFRECIIRRCDRNASTNSSLVLANFSNSQLDDEFSERFSRKTESKERKQAQIIKALKAFFKGTAPGQNYDVGREEQEFTTEITIPGPVRFKYLKQKLLDHGLLIEFSPSDGRPVRLKIPDQHHSQVKQFVTNSVPSLEIKRLIDELV